MNPLQALPMLRDVPEDSLDRFWDQATVLRFDKGATVFKQGAPADHALLIVEGRLKAWAEEGARAQPVSDIFAGELVGEAALYGRGSVRTATLKAWAPTVALQLSQADVVALSGSPAVAALQRHMLQTLARRLRTTTHATRQLLAELPQPEAPAAPQRVEVKGAEAPDEAAPRASLWAKVGQLFGRLS